MFVIFDGFPRFFWPGEGSGKRAWPVLKFGREPEPNCTLPLFLHPSHQRDTAHRSVGTGRLRARRRFGYRGEQIGHLRDQNGRHFGAHCQNSSLQSRVAAEAPMDVKSTGRLATDRKRTTPRLGFDSFPAIMQYDLYANLRFPAILHLCR
jgi:hypothetical protein